jgi:uncharacterized protein YihD (DUF1040 family)
MTEETTERIEKTLLALKEFWEEHPDMKLGQLVMIVAKKELGSGVDAFYMSDKVFLRGLEKLMEEQDEHLH